MNDVAFDFFVKNELFEDGVLASFRKEFVDYIDGDSIKDRYWSRMELKSDAEIPSFFTTTLEEFKKNNFKEHFRMNRSVFESLLIVVTSRAKFHQEPVPEISLEKKLLFSLWVLGKEESFLFVSQRFKIPITLVHDIFAFTMLILSKLMPRYVTWPTHAEQSLTSDIFEFKSRGIPGIIGVLDCTHIAIRQPTEHVYMYFNRKQYHSIILQAVCDSKGKFIDVFIGQPGSVRDSLVFKASPLHSRLKYPQRLFVNNKSHLIADISYPLNMFMLTPYRDNDNTTDKEANFNEKFISIKRVIDRAFHVQRKKFPRLKYLNVETPFQANIIVSACCMLYNYILTYDEDEWEDEQQDIMLDTKYPDNSRDPREAVEKRDNIKNLL